MTNTLDGPIRANHSRVSELNPERFYIEAICANRADATKIGVSCKIDSRESLRFALRIAGSSQINAAASATS